MTVVSEGDRKLLSSYLHYLILALRSNERFSNPTRFIDVLNEGPRNPFMAAVIDLRDQLCGTSASGSLLTLDVLRPFVEVVRSPQTPAPITAVALQAFLQFLELRCSFMDRQAVERVAAATIDARLEVADTQSHEAVLGKIIEVLVECIRHPSGAELSGTHLLSIIQACCRLALSGPPEPSELLRRTAEQAIQDIVSIIFARVRDALNSPTSNEPSTSALVSNCCPVLLFVCQLVGCDSVRTLLTSFNEKAEDGELSSPVTPSTSIRTSRINLLGLQLAHWILLVLADTLLLDACCPLLKAIVDALPRALLKVARLRQLNIVVRCSLLTTIRLLATYTALHIQPQLLSFVIAVHLLPFESSLTPPSTMSPISGDVSGGADFLSINRDEDAEMVLESLLEWCSEPHFAPFLCCYYDCSPLAPNALELLSRLLATGTAESNPFSRHLLSEAPEPPAALTNSSVTRMNTLQMLSHECLLALLMTIAGRCGTPLNSAGINLRQQCLSCRDQKAVLREFAKQFGRKSSKAVEWLLTTADNRAVVLAMGLDPNPIGEAVGQFLFRINPLLDRTEVGLYISELGRNPPDTPEDSECDAEELQRRKHIRGYTAFHEGVLRGFISAFNFQEVPLLTALRRLLSSFKLPGEAQKIDRVVQAFADHWFNSNRDNEAQEGEAPLNPFENADGPYILAFSIIMLNTDRYSSQIQAKDKMQLSAWYANNRGINNGKDLPQAYLKQIFEAILNCQIQMKEPIFDAWDDEFLWSEVIREAGEKFVQAKQGCPDPLSFATADAGLLGVLDKEIFAAIWQPALSSCARLLAAFEQLTGMGPMSQAAELRGARPLLLSQRALLGYQLCAKIAHFHEMPHILDGIVYSLCSMVIPLPAIPGHPATQQAPNSILTLETAQDFCRFLAKSVRAMDACRAIFAIARAHGAAQREGWIPLVSLIAHFYMAQLLPEQQIPLNYTQPGEEEFFFLSWTQTSPALHRRPASEHAAQLRRTGEGGGWLSFLGMGRNDRFIDDSGAVPREVLECVRTCGVSELLFHDSQLLDGNALVGLVLGLVRTSGIPVVIPKQPSDSSAPSLAGQPPPTVPPPVRAETPVVTDVQVTIFCLHTMVDVAIANKDRFDVIAPYVDQTVLMVLYGVRQALGNEEEQSLRTQQTMERQGILNYWMTIGEAAVLAALRLLTRLIHREAVHPYLARLLAVLGGLSSFLITELVSRHFIDALYLLVSENTIGLLRAREHWELLLSLSLKCGLAAKKRESCRLTYHLLECVCNGGAFVWPDNVPSLVTALTQIFTHLQNAPIPRAADEVHSGIDLSTNGQQEAQRSQEPSIRIVSLLLALHSRLLQTVGSVKVPPAGWAEAWTATLGGLSMVVCHQPTFRGDCDALLALQRAALAPELLDLPPTRIVDLFSGVLLPLLGTLLDPPQSSHTGLSTPLKMLGSLFTPPQVPRIVSPAQQAMLDDLHARTIGLVAKAFLHYLPALSRASQDFPLLWQRILISFGQYYGHGSPGVREAVKESVRNLAMVMATMCAAEVREVAEENRVFQGYPRFWHLTMDLLLANFDFAEPLVEAVRGTVAPAVPSILQHRLPRNPHAWHGASLQTTPHQAIPPAVPSVQTTEQHYSALLSATKDMAHDTITIPLAPIVVPVPAYPSRPSPPEDVPEPTTQHSPTGNTAGPSSPALDTTTPAVPTAENGEEGAAMLSPNSRGNVANYWQQVCEELAPGTATGAPLQNSGEAAGIPDSSDGMPTVSQAPIVPHPVHPPAPLNTATLQNELSANDAPTTSLNVAQTMGLPPVAPAPQIEPSTQPSSTVISSPTMQNKGTPASSTYPPVPESWANPAPNALTRKSSVDFGQPAPTRGVRVGNSPKVPSHLAPKLVPRR